MSLVERVNQDITAAMKAKAVERLSTLRMMKAALKNKEIDKRSPLEDSEAAQVLTTLIKQRRESIEQFTKGNRPELAEKEAAEIVVIEEYLPRAATTEEIDRVIDQVFSGLEAGGTKLGPRDMGTAMKAVQARLQAGGVRADGRQVSELVKARLAKG